jgi:hypothetical protein
MPYATNRQSFGQARRLNQAFYNFAHRFDDDLRSADGHILSNGRRYWDNVYLRVGELEEHIASHLPRRVSDSAPLKLSGGDLQICELMFLVPKFAVCDRSDGLCDVTRCSGVGVMTGPMMTQFMCSGRQRTIFSAYSQNDEDRQLVLSPHQFDIFKTPCYSNLGSPTASSRSATIAAALR